MLLKGLLLVHLPALCESNLRDRVSYTPNCLLPSSRLVTIHLTINLTTYLIRHFDIPFCVMILRATTIQSCHR